MTDRGWIRAYRDLFDPDNRWADETVCRRFAWLDLCQLAAYADTRRTIGADTVAVPRGHLVVSYRFLASRWGWSVKAVRTFLGALESGQDIETVRGTPRGTLYRVVKYGSYQPDGHTEGHTPGHTYGHRPGHTPSPTTTGDPDIYGHTNGHTEGHGKGTPRAQIKERNKERNTHTPREDFLPDERPALPLVFQEQAAAAGMDLDLEWETFRADVEAHARRYPNPSGAWRKWVGTELRRRESGRPTKAQGGKF